MQYPAGILHRECGQHSVQSFRVFLCIGHLLGALLRFGLHVSDSGSFPTHSVVSPEVPQRRQFGDQNRGGTDAANSIVIFYINNINAQGCLVRVHTTPWSSGVRFDSLLWCGYAPEGSVADA